MLNAVDSTKHPCRREKIEMDQFFNSLKLALVQQLEKCCLFKDFKFML